MEGRRSRLALTTANLGGRLAKWRGDGKELFFVGLDGSRIVAASIRTAGTGIESDTPHTLFLLPIMLDVQSPYDVTSDGQRFLVLERTISQATPLAVVLNWQADCLTDIVGRALKGEAHCDRP